MRNKLFKIVGVVALLAVIGLAASKVIPGPEGTNGTLINPYDVYDETHRIRHMKPGSVSDSIEVHNDATDYTRRIAPINTLIANYISGSVAYSNTPARTLVTGTGAAGFQISATKNTRVSYTVTHTIALSLVLTSGSSQVFLEISPTGTGSWTAISQAGYSDGVAVAVALTKSTTSNVQGEVPAGYYARLRTVVSGGGSAAFTCGQEVQY